MGQEQISGVCRLCEVWIYGICRKAEKQSFQKYGCLFSSGECILRYYMRNVAEKLMVNAVERNVKLLVHVDEKIQIMGQGDQMVQLVLIIGDNALKYTPENGTVTFVTELQQDGSVKMTISDQGPGIPEEDLPFIWERFYKVDKSHSRNVPGTGLGLAIAREIIRMHGAKVQVFSKLGEGTRFEITFPKDKVISE